MLTVLLLAIFAALCLQGLTEGVGQARTDSLVGTATVSGGGSVLYGLYATKRGERPLIGVAGAACQCTVRQSRPTESSSRRR